MARYGAIVWLWLSVVVVVFDQVTKIAAEIFLVYNQPVAVLPFFDLRLLYNTGAAFSFLANAGGWQRWLFTLLAVGISVGLTVWLVRMSPQQRWLACGVALIIGGAVGNLIDRVLYGYVIDFISLYYQEWYYPAFNVADSAISVGAVMLLWDAFFGKHPSE